MKHCYVHICTLQELIGHYQKYSLKSVFPEVTTTLKYCYYEITSPPKSKIALPWPISPEIPPPGVDALDQPGGSPKIVSECAYLRCIHTYTLYPSASIMK